MGVTVYDWAFIHSRHVYDDFKSCPLTERADSASHHPYDKNGLKYFTKEGGLSGKDIERIIKTAESLRRLLVRRKAKS